MKKFTLILVGMFLFATSFAEKGEGWIGIKGGLNMATIKTDYSNLVPKTLNGYNAGFVMGGLMGKSKVMFEMSLLYSTKGWKEEATESGVTGIYKNEFNYIDMPVNFGYRFTLGKNIYFSPLIGFYCAYALSGKESFEASGSGVTANVSVPLTFGYEKTDNYFNWDLGLNVGANFELKNIQLSARYAPAISSPDIHGSGYIHHNVISLSAAYLFRINKSK
jgi:hypothetical protein